MSGFSTLNTAISGLMAAQRGLDITGQNVVNANTAGYSRQVMRASAVGQTTAANFHTGGTNTFFAGVTIDSVSRIRDSFLEGARVQAGASLEALKAQSAALSGAEELLSEPGELGLSGVLDDFHAAWHDLSLRPDDTAAGSVVITRGQSTAAQLRFTATGVAEDWNTSREQLGGVVAEVNQTAKDLANVNLKIREGVVAERSVNELVDQRDQLVRKLGDMIGARATETDDNMVDVQVNGVNLVSGVHSTEVKLTGTNRIQGAATDPPSISLGAYPVSIPGGKAAGLLAALRTDLPGVMTKLDTIATTLRDSVNSVHEGGFTLDGHAGGEFFTGTGAFDIDVRSGMAVADLAVAGSTGVMDGSNALKLGDLSIDANASAALGGGLGPSATLRGLTADLGTQIQGLDRAVSVQSGVVDTTESQVESTSGVNLDEEMAALLSYQRSYQASARVITAMDEVLDVLVNRLGTVGR